ncbi:twin-arginine translocase subunit TatC [uncultured Microbacterium sp.]|nr:twin-arginine translocase subunit TatC [uncultured Microbacterium sp.]
MSLGDHLRELRKRVVIAAIAIVVAAIIGFILTEPIIKLLLQPIAQVAQTRGDDYAKLTFDVITGAFDLRLRIAIAIGVVIAAPIWMLQIWLFVAPGLTKREVRYALGFLGAAIPLFFAGCWVGFTIAPHVIELLLGFAPDEEHVATYLTASYYYDFIFKLLLVIGVAFVLPVFLVLLNFLGVISGKGILKGWRIAIIAATAFAAAATPAADVTSMVFLAVVLIVLYLAAAGVSIFFDRYRARRAAREAQEPVV